ncbi:MAG: SsrA-binding protein SmpB [Magnetococcales bacterium]|nr:SsrA-binding protein SmpB [Magnetococcales bacterium]
MGIKIISENRKAFYNYEILDRFEAGVVLTGPEVKSLRAGRVNLNDSYALVHNGELVWLNGNISPYRFASITPPDPLRTRTLLVHKQEIRRLVGFIQEKGLTLLPLKVYWKEGRVKLEIGVGRGKKLHDKRDTEKERDWQREKEYWMKHG